MAKRSLDTTSIRLPQAMEDTLKEIEKTATPSLRLFLEQHTRIIHDLDKMGRDPNFNTLVVNYLITDGFSRFMENFNFDDIETNTPGYTANGVNRHDEAKLLEMLEIAKADSSIAKGVRNGAPKPPDDEAHNMIRNTIIKANRKQRT